MRYGSVCSGIEAASVAWEPLGMTPAWFAEVDKFPSTVLAHHWPYVENLGDMTTIADAVRAGRVEAPDILVGGTPCQAFSVAGARGGLDDERGQLTIKFVEIADAIDEQRGAGDEGVIVWENVPGVLSSKDNAFGCFLGLLAGEDSELQPAGKKWTNAGCVYGPKRAIAWRILDAQYFGVAQRRRRVFVVASARDGFDPTKVLFESDGLRRDIAPSRETGETVAALTANGVGTCGADDNQGQAGHLVPVGCWWDGGQLSQTLNAVRRKGQTMPEKNRFPAVLQPIAIHDKATRHKGGGSTRQGDGSGNGLGISEHYQPMYTITTADKHAVAYENAVRRITPINLQVITRSRSLGRGTGFGLGVEGDASYTIGAGHEHGVWYDTVVRRITPIEAERLQGFPDNHTRIPWRGKSPKDCPDGPRYKAIGNSMAVPVMQWLGARALEELY